MKIVLLYSSLIFSILISYSYSKEILITSDKLMIDRETNISTFSGNVYVDEKNMKIWADQLIVKLNYDEDEIEEIFAKNNVKIIRDNIKATSEIGYYYPLIDEIKMLENVEVTEDNNIVKCDELVIDIKNSISIMSSSSDKRVEATIINNN